MKKVLNDKLTKNILIIILSSFISAIGMNAFIIPNKLLSGGVGGIALIIHYLTNFPVGYGIILINIPLFILSIKELDKEFTILTIFGILAQSIFLNITRGVSNFVSVNDILLAAIYGGIIQGIAVGMIFRSHGSLGGSDIVSLIIRKKYHFDIGTVTFIINLVIVSVGASLFGINKGLYSLMNMYLVSYSIDKVIKGFNRKKLLFIISNKEDQIVERIKTDLKRSSTFLFGEGTYTGKQLKVIYCVVSLTQVPKIKTIVQSIDPFAFISILDTSEVEGKGFESPI